MWSGMTGTCRQLTLGLERQCVDWCLQRRFWTPCGTMMAGVICAASNEPMPYKGAFTSERQRLGVVGLNSTTWKATAGGLSSRVKLLLIMSSGCVAGLPLNARCAPKTASDDHSESFREWLVQTGASEQQIELIISLGMRSKSDLCFYFLDRDEAGDLDSIGAKRVKQHFSRRRRMLQHWRIPCYFRLRALRLPQPLEPTHRGFDLRSV